VSGASRRDLLSRGAAKRRAWTPHQRGALPSPRPDRSLMGSRPTDVVLLPAPSGSRLLPRGLRAPPGFRWTGGSATARPGSCHMAMPPGLCDWQKRGDLHPAPTEGDSGQRCQGSGSGACPPVLAGAGGGRRQSVLVPVVSPDAEHLGRDPAVIHTARGLTQRGRGGEGPFAASTRQLRLPSSPHPYVGHAGRLSRRGLGYSVPIPVG